MSKEQMITKLIEKTPYTKEWYQKQDKFKIFGMYQKYVLKR